MAASKDELLAQLFALRAGLSAISVETEHVKSDESAIEDEKSKVADVYKKLHEIDNKEADVNNQLQLTKRELERKIASRDKDIERNIRYNKSEDAQLKVGIACAMSLFTGIVFTFVMIFVSNTLHIAIPGIIVSTVVFVIAVVWNIRYLNKLSEKYTAEVDSEIYQLDKSITIAKNAISDLENKRQEWNDTLDEICETRDNNIALYNDSISEHARVAMLYNNALENYFGSLLSPSDWQNIDLCIYYLQTGRAESLKECLQLVDRQRQTDEIINTVKQASNRICDEIRSGFNALGRTMVKCFNSVSAQLESISNQIANEHASVIKALNEISSGNAALLSATQLNNALLKKATVTSEQLAQDLNYIKQYA